MAKVTSPDDTLKVTKSIRGVFICVKNQQGNYYIKKYFKPYPFDTQAHTAVKENIELKRVEWNSLSQAQKDAWQVIADNLFMSGEVLYKSQGFKEGMTSLSGVAVCNQTYVG